MNGAGEGPRVVRGGALTTGVLAMLAMFGPFSTDAVFPAFASMQTQFGASTAAMQQVTSVYLLGFAAMSILHGPISDAIGRKPVILVGTLCYAAASVGCALSTSLPMLLVFRALQGLCAGGGSIVSRAIIGDLYVGAPARRLMSHVSMIFGLAPAVAPILGGLLLGLGRWPLIFAFLAVFGVACAVSSAYVLPETLPPDRRRPLRVRGVLAGLAEVGRSTAFWRVTGAQSLSFSGQFTYIAGAPIFVVALLGRGERDFWMLFVPMIAGMIVGAFLSGRLAHRTRGRTMVRVGLGIALVTGLLNVALSATPATAGLPYAVLAPSLIAFGLALAVPIFTLSVLEMFPEHRGSASSLMGFASLIVSAALAGIVVPLVSGTLLSMALASLAFLVAGATLWAWHERADHPNPPTTEHPESLEPTDLM